MHKNTMLGDMKVIFVSKNGGWIAVHKDSIRDPKQKRRPGRKPNPKPAKPKQEQITEESEYVESDECRDEETDL